MDLYNTVLTGVVILIPITMVVVISRQLLRDRRAERERPARGEDPGANLPHVFESDGSMWASRCARCDHTRPDPIHSV